MAMARFGPCLYSVSCVLAPPYHFFGPLIKVVSAQAGSIEEGIAQSRAGLSMHRGPLNQAQAAAPPRRPHAPAAAPCSSCAPSPSCSRPHLAESRLLLRSCRTATPDPKAHRVAVAVKRLNQRGLQVSFDFTSSHLSSFLFLPSLQILHSPFSYVSVVICVARE
jgi:hypothetical protein